MEITTKDKMVLPCLRGVIGGWVYYSSLMSARQINDWIETAKSIREAKTLDDYLQRTLKERKQSIANYLLKNQESRFFNSIIVGVFDSVPDWLEFDLDKAANIIGSSESMKNIKESVGLMILNGHERMFAIDGQHRVEGIKIAFAEDTSEELKDDQFSVIFVAHIDDAEGKKKTRRLFSDINKKAVPVAKGDKILIDEDDISAIVTRRVYISYPNFLEGKIISITENAKLEEHDTTNFTNLLSVYSVSKIVKTLHTKEKKVGNLDESNIEAFKKVVTDFFDWAIVNCDEYNRYFVLKNFTLAEARVQNKHLLFRPVGISLLAKLYAYFSKQNKLTVLESKLSQLSFIMPDSIFNKILWNNGKMEAASSNSNLAFELSKYLLGETFTYEQTANLLAKYKTITKNDSVVLPAKFT
jgi:DNA sulfur modification protein DndB